MPPPLAPAIALALALCALPLRAQDFDYWLLALSWLPSWCAAEADRREAEQCAEDRDLGFVLHGLWPQYEDGWPEYCTGLHDDPSRRETAAMADIAGSGGLAWHSWQKHGTCTGLPSRDYFALARALYESLDFPELDGPVNAGAVESAFLDANPDLAPEDLIVTCGEGRVEEVRLCLDLDLAPRRCAPDVAARACRSRAPLDLPDAP